MGKLTREIVAGSVGALLVLAVLLGFDLSFLILPASLVVLLSLIRNGRPNLLQGDLGLSGLGSNDDSKIPLVTFEDIGGQDVAKRELLEALAFLKESDRSAQLGIRPLKGVLLAGPPGTGKTLMAKAAANYTGSVFVSASGSQFVQMYAGVGASRVRQLFKQARTLAEQGEKTSAIIFIDEIDVLRSEERRVGKDGVKTIVIWSMIKP